MTIYNGVPDPQQALLAYNGGRQPPPVSNEELDSLMRNAAQLPPQAAKPQGPDPQAALAAYGGQPMPDTSKQALGQVNNAVADQQASNNLRAQVASNAAKQAEIVQSEAGVDAAMHGEELLKAQEEHKAEIGKILEDGESTGERPMYQRVLGGVAVAMGGLADQTNLVAGLNMGMNVQTHNAERIANGINAQIDRDIALQRAKLSDRKDASNQGYAENTQALQLAHAAKIEQAQAALQSIASQAQSKDVVESVNGANAKLEQDKQALNMGVLQQREAARAKAAAGANRPQSIDYGSMTPVQLKALADAGVLPAEGHKVLKSIAPDKDEKWSRTGELSGYVATQELSAGDMAEARKIDAATRSLEKDYDTLAAIRERNKGATWNRTDMNEAERIIDSMPAKFSQTFGSGAPSQQEMERFEKSLVNPTDVHLLKDPAEVYKRGKQSIRDNATVKLDSYGFKPGGDKPVLPAGVQEKLDALHTKHAFRTTGQ